MKDPAYEHLQIPFIKSFCDRLRNTVMLSSQVFSSDFNIDHFFHLMDVLENTSIDLN